MKVDKDNKPPVGGMGGSIHDWERSSDPWHVDAFKGIGGISADEWANKGKRADGWMALDWCGNSLGFVADGTELDWA